MKLRNKLTGEINILKVDEDYFNIYKDDGEFVCPVTLKELNDGWEDVPEEPKEYWYIDDSGGIMIDQVLSSEINMRKSIGNYFGALEEAEKAQEKLKAWKRLEDKGFRFDKVSGCWIEFTLPSATSDEDYEQGQKDLHLLFGGEE